MYEIQYTNSHYEVISANVIAENLFEQVNKEGKRHVTIDQIIDIRSNGKEIQEKDAFQVSPNGI